MPAFSNDKIVIKLINLGKNTDLHIHSLHIKYTAEFLKLIPQVMRYFYT